MQLNAQNSTGAIRNLIIAADTLFLQPLNTTTQQGIVPYTHGEIDYSVLGAAIVLLNMPNECGSYEKEYIKNRGHQISINLNIIGIKHADLNKIETLTNGLTILVNLYVDAPNTWIVVGDKLCPTKLTEVKINSGGKNSDQANARIKFQSLQRAIPPLYTINI